MAADELHKPGDTPSESVTHIYRMQDKLDPYRYMDFDPRAWSLIVVPIRPEDGGIIGYTTAVKSEAAVSGKP